jgi:hypothetical protein
VKIKKKRSFLENDAVRNIKPSLFCVYKKRRKKNKEENKHKNNERENKIHTNRTFSNILFVL